jgi:Zn-dependent M16 (insulinase) family peptidase
LEHQKSGAQLLHLAKEDESNNVFSIGFPTLNNTSDGVAHILVIIC